MAFFSRSYARNANHRPTLERLSFICFEKGQWDNAWRATEALLDRYRSTLAEGDLAELFVRSALCDVHIAQRLAATAQLGSMVSSTSGGMRDLAETWAAMRFEPRLLGGLEGERRTRVLDRLRDALATERCPPAARRQAWGLLGAFATVERRWGDARDALEFLSADGAASPSERCGFLIAAGDIALTVERNVEAGHRFYARARAQSAGDARLVERDERSRDEHSGREDRGSDGAFTEEIARDNTDEIVR